MAEVDSFVGLRTSNGQVFSQVGDPPVPGASLELTIDATLQHIAERELQASRLVGRLQFIGAADPELFQLAPVVAGVDARAQVVVRHLGALRDCAGTPRLWTTRSSRKTHAKCLAA